jgi:hypothetical protein
MKLSDTQRAILTAAAQQQDRLVKPPAIPPGPRGAIEAKLRNAELIEPVRLGGEEHATLVWRWTDGTAQGYRITDEGLRAIGVDPDAGIGPDSVEHGAALANAAPVAHTARTGAKEDAPAGDDAPAPKPAHAAPTPAPRRNLRDAATAVLAAWDDEANRETDIIAALDGPMETLRTLLAGKPARSPRGPGAPRKPREGTKQERVLGMLRREEGATIAQICEATGWQQHTVRGFFAGLKKRHGITVIAAERIRQVGPNKEGAKGSFTIYRVAG